MKPFSFHSRRSRIGAVCTMLLAAQLAACGGDDDPAPAPPPSGENPAPTPPEPATVALTLTGRVTDEPIAGAEVTAAVGDQEFTATADESGDYSIEIEIEEADAASFVTLHARGVGAQSFVEFTSLAGSFQSLAGQAGDDDTLSNDENFATQITNVSTAEAVLMVEANGGQPVTSDAALQSLGNDVNAQDVLDLASAIKLAVDDAENYPLPEGQTSILELASDADARQQFVNDVYEQDPAAFAATQAAIVEDAGLAQPIDTTQDLSFTAALLSSEAGFSFNYSGRVTHFDLLEDGTGSVSSATYDQALTWTVEGSTIKVLYTSPVETISYDFENCVGGGGMRQVEAHYVSSGATIAFISERTVAITTESDVTYADCDSLEPREDVSTAARTVLTMDNLTVIDMEELYGEAQTIYVWDGTQQGVIADIADINADGTGTTRLTSKSFTWVTDETGKLITATFNDGTEVDYGSMRDIGELASDLYWEVRMPGDGPVYVGAGASVFLDPEYAVDFTAEDVPGRYYQFGVGAEDVPDPRLKGFRLRFDADFTGAQEDDYIDENDSVVTLDETVQSYNGFRWVIDGDAVVVRRTFDTVAQVETCLLGEANCHLYDERRIIPLAMDDGARVYWIEVRRFDNVNWVTASTPATYLVRYYDYEPFEGAAAASAKPGSAKSSVAPPARKPRALLRGPQLR